MVSGSKRLDLNLLAVLEALLQLRSTKAAGRRLGVSQPAVSHALRRLRAHFGDELFRRTQSGLAPTEFALSLAEPLARALCVIRDEIESAGAFSPASSHRRFTIASSEVGELLLLPPLLEAMRAKAPQAALDWQPIPTRSLEQAMSDGAVDLLVSGTLENADETQFYQQRLYSHEFVGLIRTDHPLLKTGEAERAVHDLPAYVMTSGRAARERIEGELAKAGVELATDLTTSRLLSYPFMLQGADAFAVAPRAVALIAGRFAPVASFALPFPLPRIEVRQYWHRRFHENPANIWLRNLVARTFMNRDPTPGA